MAPRSLFPNILIKQIQVQRTNASPLKVEGENGVPLLIFWDMR